MKRRWPIALFLLALVTAAVFIFLTACAPQSTDSSEWYHLIWVNQRGEVISVYDHIAREDLSTATQNAPDMISSYEDDENFYEFIGWDLDFDNLPSHGGEITIHPKFKTTAKRDMTFTVTWIIGDRREQTQVAFGADPIYDGTSDGIPVLEPTEDTVFVFSYWSPYPNPVYSDVEYTAYFSEQTRLYDVVFTLGDKELFRDQVAYGEMPEYRGDPVVFDATTVYHITGWDQEPAPVAGNATYRATYETEVRRYSVYWKLNEVVGYEEFYEYGEMPEYRHETPEQERAYGYSYTFRGWSPAIETVTDDVVYTAEFDATPITYTVKWKVNGEITAQQEYHYGDSPSYPYDTPTKTKVGYDCRFDYWSDEASGYGLHQVYDDTVFVAQFLEEQIEYEIKFNLNNNGRYYVLRYHYGETPNYDLEYYPAPAQESTNQYTYTFIGWDREFEPVTENTEYTAQFKEEIVQYNVTWLDDDGNILSVDKFDYGATPVYTGDSVPKKAASTEYVYEFSEWRDSWGNRLSVVIYDVTYHPVYTRSDRYYTITWKIDDVETTTQCKYNQTPVYSETPQRECETEGYEWLFSGWQPEIASVKGDKTYTATFLQFAEADLANLAFSNHSVSVKNNDAEILVIPPYYNGVKVEYITSFGSSKATEIHLPATIQHIRDPFPANTARVYYDGTEAEFSCIGLDVSRVHCLFPAQNKAALYVEGDKLLTKATVGFPANRAVSPFSGCGSIVEVETANPGTQAFANCLNLTKVTVTEGTTGIGSYAFSGCTALTDVTLPSTLESILFGSFSGCSALESIVFPASLTSLADNVFENCDSLMLGPVFTVGAAMNDISSDALSGVGHIEEFAVAAGNDSYIVVDGVLLNATGTEIVAFPSEKTGKYTFPATMTELQDALVMPKITALEVPPTVTTYSSFFFLLKAPELKTLYWNTDADMPGRPAPYGAFEQFSLDDLIVGDNVTQIPDYCFNRVPVKHVTLGKNLQSIGNGAFYTGTSSLSFASILESVTVLSTGDLTIGEEAFKSCFKLTDVTGNLQNITTLKSGAFMECQTLKSFTFSNRLTEIPNNLFFGCSVLQIDALPDSLTKIGSQAFRDCTLLALTSLPATVTEIGDYAFDHSAVAFSTLPAGITVIYPGSFRASNVTFSTLPNGVTGIASEAFRGCYEMTEITIPNSVIAIGSSAFSYCANLTAVHFPVNGSLKRIEEAAFLSCTSLTSVTIPKTVELLGNQAFAFCFDSSNNGAMQSFTIVDGTALRTFDLRVIFSSYPTRLYVGEGVTSITGRYTDVVYLPKKIEKTYLPSTLTVIGENSLSYTKSDYTDIRLFYKGTEEQFQQITGYYEYWDQCKVAYYSETTPNQTGKYWHYIDDNMVIWWSI